MKLYFMIGVAESFVGGEKMSTIVFGLAVWLTLNAAFVALRLYVSSSGMSHSDNLRPRYPRLVRTTNQAAV
jgi:hypothetical protein